MTKTKAQKEALRSTALHLYGRILIRKGDQGLAAAEAIAAAETFEQVFDAYVNPPKDRADDAAEQAEAEAAQKAADEAKAKADAEAEAAAKAKADAKAAEAEAAAKAKAAKAKATGGAK
ncbi:MAG TPA: hypothetical protein DCY40_05990 [Actinobacteria bacterium]|nr:hypothetical protein [Actinomycetota bacterium]